jgi:hypothetical protein
VKETREGRATRHQGPFFRPTLLARIREQDNVTADLAASKSQLPAVT